MSHQKIKSVSVEMSIRKAGLLKATTKDITRRGSEKKKLVKMLLSDTACSETQPIIF